MSAKKPPNHCECGKQLSSRNRSGKCVPCFNRAAPDQPGWRERQRAGIMRKLENDPMYRADLQRRAVRNNLNASPEGKARQRQQGLRQAATLIACNIAMTTEQRAANGRKRTETLLGWCPPEWRDRYREMTIRGVRAPVARQRILDAIAKEKADRLAAMTPFERQMARVAAGAKLVTKPVLRRADHDFTLGGVSGGML